MQRKLTVINCSNINKLPLGLVFNPSFLMIILTACLLLVFLVFNQIVPRMTRFVYCYFAYFFGLFKIEFKTKNIDKNNTHVVTMMNCFEPTRKIFF